MYTLLGSTNKFASGNWRVLLKLFARMILPICTYNCEVWGSTFFTRKFVPSDFLSERQLKNAVDKVNCVFIKQILRVNSKASNWAVLSETNRSSLIPGIMPRMISFWKHLQDSPSPIIEETVKLSKTLHEENHYSWPIKSCRNPRRDQWLLSPSCTEKIGNYGCIYIYPYLLKFYVNFSKPFVYRVWFVSVIKIAMCFKFAVELQTFKNIRL